LSPRWTVQISGDRRDGCIAPRDGYPTDQIACLRQAALPASRIADEKQATGDQAQAGSLVGRGCHRPFQDQNPVLLHQDWKKAALLALLSPVMLTPVLWLIMRYYQYANKCS